MKKKLLYSLLSLIVVFSSIKCKNADILPNSLLIRQGDTLIYANSTNKKDTFRVTSLRCDYLGSMNNYYQDLQFVIDKVNKSIPDTAGFYQLQVEVNEKTGLYLWFCRATCVEDPLYFGTKDSLYEQISLGGKSYNSVNYYSAKLSTKSHCKDLYYSYQYGMLSIKVNNNLIYLSEVKPVR